ncbi:MAG: PIG-L family deacetylase [Myxococcota bacterium]
MVAASQPWRFLAALGLALSAGCASLPPPAVSLDQVLQEDGARVLWVGAHPDDESLAGPILARACRDQKRPCTLLVMNHGDGGECLRWPNCHPGLATVRGEEEAEVARRYHAKLIHLYHFNAPLPFDSFPRREALAARWIREGDPTITVAEVIRDFRPTVLLTFDPEGGFTHHPEHQLASRFAMAGAALAGAQDSRLKGAPYTVPHAYEILNHYWPSVISFRADPGEPTEVFDTHVPCGSPGRTCLDVALRITHAHQTQARDMRTIRLLRPQMGYLYVRAVTPAEETKRVPPTEPERR